VTDTMENAWKVPNRHLVQISP